MRTTHRAGFSPRASDLVVARDPRAQEAVDDAK